MKLFDFFKGRLLGFVALAGLFAGFALGATMFHRPAKVVETKQVQETKASTETAHAKEVVDQALVEAEVQKRLAQERFNMKQHVKTVVVRKKDGTVIRTTTKDTTLDSSSSSSSESSKQATTTSQDSKESSSQKTETESKTTTWTKTIVAQDRFMLGLTLDASLKDAIKDPGKLSLAPGLEFRYRPFGPFWLGAQGRFDIRSKGLYIGVAAGLSFP